MANSFAIPPDLGDESILEFDPYWTCPHTGLVVPKRPVENLQYRAELLARAEEDQGLRDDLMTASRLSILFWVNTFGWTKRIFEQVDGRRVRAKHTNLPFVTWKYQDPHILRIEECVREGGNLLTDKSRDMGATWDHLVVFGHQFIYEADANFLCISNKEDNVDQPTSGSLADPSTLFGKLDFLFDMLPEWMAPRIDRKKMHMVNMETGGRIDGESANANAGTSGRRKAILADEMAKMDYAKDIKRSIRDVTATIFACSTPNGPGTVYSQWRTSGTIPVYVLPWWDHPEKGKGRYVSKEPDGKYRIRSPWYDKEEEERSPRELAIEVDMDHFGSGNLFFEPQVLEMHKVAHGKDPRYVFSVDFPDTMSSKAVQRAVATRQIDRVRAVPDRRNGLLRLWTELIGGRPDQTKTYVVACDISKGMGASNSTISIFEEQANRKIGEWASANYPPHEFARIAVAVCLWVGGKNRYPLLIWENNGDPGFDFGRQIMKVFEYPYVYFDKAVGTRREKRGKRYGWRSNREKKAQVLGELRRAYAHGGFINPSREAIDEAATYVYLESGGVGPGDLVKESEAARLTHGDRVIADALCLVGAKKRQPAQDKAGTRSTRTFAGRLHLFKQDKKTKLRRKMYA